eukprot:SAG31_NODE_2317_length_5947_cov_2.753591_2_plen_71_part_00
MNEGMFHKAAGDGVPTGWHQDGRTHWTEDGAPLAAGRTGKKEPDSPDHVALWSMLLTWAMVGRQQGLRAR